MCNLARNTLKRKLFLTHENVAANDDDGRDDDDDDDDDCSSEKKRKKIYGKNDLQLLANLLGKKRFQCRPGLENAFRRKKKFV